MRVMPNIPVLAGCGATVYVRGRHASEADADITKRLFSAVGLCEEVPESMINPITALAGSGPAYVSTFRLSSLFFEAKYNLTRIKYISLAQ